MYSQDLGSNVPSTSELQGLQFLYLTNEEAVPDSLCLSRLLSMIVQFLFIWFGKQSSLRISPYGQGWSDQRWQLQLGQTSKNDHFLFTMPVGPCHYHLKWITPTFTSVTVLPFLEVISPNLWILIHPSRPRSKTTSYRTPLSHPSPPLFQDSARIWCSIIYFLVWALVFFSSLLPCHSD